MCPFYQLQQLFLNLAIGIIFTLNTFVDCMWVVSKYALNNGNWYRANMYWWELFYFIFKRVICLKRVLILFLIKSPNCCKYSPHLHTNHKDNRPESICLFFKQFTFMFFAVRCEQGTFLLKWLNVHSPVCASQCSAHTTSHSTEKERILGENPY